MKKRLYTALIIPVTALALACDVDKEVYTPVDFEVRLNPGNTYLVGEDVQFDFVGDANFIVLYNGTTGHEYRFHERTEVALEDMEYCRLEITGSRRTGAKAGVTFWVSDQFAGIKGGSATDLSNLAADKATIDAMVASGMDGWEGVPFDNEPATGTSFTLTYDISHLASNFSLGMHWNPAYAPPSPSQSGYWINPVIRTKFKGYEEQEYQYRHTEIQVLAMPTERALDAYDIMISSDKPGYVRMPPTGNNQFVMTGIGGSGTDLGYQIDTWVLNTPLALNRIASDKGENIKGYSTNLSFYRVRYWEPGTYTATFVATNGNYVGESRVIRELTFTVVEPI